MELTEASVDERETVSRNVAALRFGCQIAENSARLTRKPSRSIRVAERGQRRRLPLGASTSVFEFGNGFVE
jgi:hypothetical protein